MIAVEGRRRSIGRKGITLVAVAVVAATLGALGGVAYSAGNPPAAPTIGTATAGIGQVTVRWTAPASDGGSAITGYLVSHLDGSDRLVSVRFSSTATTQTITGLPSGGTYRFWVAAINAIGTGGYSRASNQVIVATVPGAPTITKNASALTTQATVSWTAPSSNGGSPITGYIVTPVIGAIEQPPTTFNATTTTQTVTGLQSSTTYRFKVQAVNVLGAGAASALSNEVSTGPLPGGPTSAAAIPGDRRAIVTWTAPTSDGGSPITGYSVTPYIGFFTLAPQVFDSTATTGTVVGLTNGTSYGFRVRAINAAGTGAFSTATIPVTPNRVTSISAGPQAACALWESGEVSCWGNGLIPGSNAETPLPTLLAGITDAQAMSFGSGFLCVLLPGATVTCRGNNYYGSLGDGTTTDATTPVPVVGLSNVTAISASEGGHACALIADGTIECWGRNDYGQLGNGTVGPPGSIGEASTPIPVTGISDAIAVSAGGIHSCAVLAGGSIKCWGFNVNGVLGDETTTNSSTPVTVSGIANATAVDASEVATCALLDDGTMRCWGSNVDWQLGNQGFTSTPVTVAGISDAIWVAAGDLDQRCAVLVGGTIKCWGANEYGQLGDGTTTTSMTPVTVSGITDAVTVDAGEYYTCALLGSGVVKCWGDNEYGQLGNTSVIGYAPSPITTTLTVPGQ